MFSLLLHHLAASVTVIAKILITRSPLQVDCKVWKRSTIHFDRRSLPLLHRLLGWAGTVVYCRMMKTRHRDRNTRDDRTTRVQLIVRSGRTQYRRFARIDIAVVRRQKQDRRAFIMHIKMTVLLVRQMLGWHQSLFIPARPLMISNGLLWENARQITDSISGQWIGSLLLTRVPWDNLT